MDKIVLIVVKLCNKWIASLVQRPSDYNNNDMLPIPEYNMNHSVPPTYNINVAPANKYYNFR
jgi:hypothetical protein